MGPTWGPSGADKTRWAPYWPHELCYRGLLPTHWIYISFAFSHGYTHQFLFAVYCYAFVTLDFYNNVCHICCTESNNISINTTESKWYTGTWTAASYCGIFKKSGRIWNKNYVSVSKLIERVQHEVSGWLYPNLKLTGRVSLQRTERHFITFGELWKWVFM